MLEAKFFVDSREFADEGAEKGGGVLHVLAADNGSLPLAPAPRPLTLRALIGSESEGGGARDPVIGTSGARVHGLGA